MPWRGGRGRVSRALDRLVLPRCHGLPVCNGTMFCSSFGLQLSLYPGRSALITFILWRGHVFLPRRRAFVEIDGTSRIGSYWPFLLGHGRMLGN